MEIGAHPVQSSQGLRPRPRLLTLLDPILLLKCARTNFSVGKTPRQLFSTPAVVLKTFKLQ